MASEAESKSGNKYITDIIVVISIAVIIAVSVIMLINAGHTYLCEDDFSFETGVAKGGYTLAGAVDNAIGYCMEMQGTYLSVFLYFFLGPYGRWGIHGFHAVMIIMAILFNGSLLYLIKELTRKNALWFTTGALALLSVFQMRESTDCQELFSWYTGSINYTLELALAFIAAGLCIRSFRTDPATNRVKSCVFSTVSAVIGFLASLGCLQISACNCAFLLAIIIFAPEGVLKKGSRHRLLPFCASLAGALLNVLCPGNYTRADTWTSENHTSFSDALIDTFRCQFQETLMILKSPVFILVLCLCFAAGLMFSVRIREKGMSILYLVITLAGVYLTQFFTAFPAIYGYHSTDLISARTKATYEIVARLLYILLVLCIAQWVHEKFPGIIIAAASAVMVAGILLCVFRSDITVSDTKDGYAYRIAYDIYSGNQKRNYDTRMKVIKTMEDADKWSDLVIEVPLEDVTTESAYGMGLSDDPGYIVNLSAATMFDLNSVSVFYR